jgi:cation diffusion facilitator CzcD-associated flavoprotein CzcO
MRTVDVAIVGAGPYGLSLAAHLQQRGLTFSIFGTPMQVWREHMPKGMLLKSDGFASNLSDPNSAFTLRHFCESARIPYDDTRIPVALETFARYGTAFQERFAPELDQRHVASIEQMTNDHFRLCLEDGSCLGARRVVIAVGISHFAFIPSNLAGVPAAFLSHSSAHKDPAAFRGSRVTIVGGGASAIDLAALMYENGANVRIVARRAAIAFHNPPGSEPRSLWQQIRHPASGMGPGWKSRFFSDAPGLFRHFPDAVRVKIVREHLGPAPGWPMKARVVGKVPMSLGTSDLRANVRDSEVHLTFVNDAGAKEEQFADHVVAATGYQVDIHRLTFFSEEIQTQVKTVGGAPVLSSTFQSSVPGLYFTGIAAANTFGPMMRFAFGSEYTARQISASLVKVCCKTEEVEAVVPSSAATAE